MRDVAVDETEAAWLERHLLTLTGVQLARSPGHASLDESFGAWRRFVEALAEKGPAVLVFEDLHWADDALLDFVDSLADRVAGVALLVVGSARPELLERRPGWGGGKRNAATISLAPLTDEETARLLAGLLGTPVLAAERQAALLQRAGGNPLFAEEYWQRGDQAGATPPGTSRLRSRSTARSARARTLPRPRRSFPWRAERRSIHRPACPGNGLEATHG